MTTKKRRRRQLARASAERRAVRRAQRAVHRRRIRIVSAVVLGVLVVAGIAVWASLHDPGSRSGSGRIVDYDALPVDHNPTANQEVPR
ncbi:MAG: hypothetical protein ACXVW2_01945 [Nocardioidaceae bacterium]